MAGVYQLCHIFEFVVYCLNDRPFAQQYLVIQRHQLVLHIALQPRHQVDTVVKQAVEQLLRDVSFVCEQLSENVVTQTVKHIFVPIVNVGLCKHEVEHLPSFIAYEMQLEPKVPSHGAFANLCIVLEHLVSGDSFIVADRHTRAVYETNACASAEAEQLQEQHHLYAHT